MSPCCPEVHQHRRLHLVEWHYWMRGAVREKEKKGRKRGKVEEVKGWQDGGRKVVTQKLGPCSLSSLTSQTHFSKKGRVWWTVYTSNVPPEWVDDIIRFQIMHSWITSCGVSKLSKEYSRRFYSSCSSGKDVLALFCCFQDHHCYSNSDVSCDKLLQCDWTILYSMARHGWYMQFTRPFPFLRKWVWLVRLQS